jgi:hypothetical protein
MSFLPHLILWELYIISKFEICVRFSCRKYALFCAVETNLKFSKIECPLDGSAAHVFKE